MVALIAADPRLLPRGGRRRPPLLALPGGTLRARDQCAALVRAGAVRMNTPAQPNEYHRARTRGVMNMSNLGYPAHSCIFAYFRKASRGSPYMCEAGVNMDVWRKLKHEQMPCFLDQNGHSQPGAAHCAHLRRPTPEEIAAYEQVLKQLNEKIHIAIASVADWREAHKGQSASTVVECPICKGRLHLSLTDNDCVQGDCENERCVRWYAD